MKKALKLFIMSLVASFCLTFAMIIINAVMGIFIGINYYFAIFILLSGGLSVGLILMYSKNIFAKKKVSKIAKSKNSRRRKYVHTNDTRRKIS